jgi:uncharacterized protein YkwD
MRLTMKLTTATLIFFAVATSSRAEDAKIEDSLARDQEAPRKTEMIASRTPDMLAPRPRVAPTVPAADPYGFAAHLNSYRASAGLPPLQYNPELSNWAALNNSHQNSRGLGHHVNPNCLQNSCWNTTSAAHTMRTWADSRSHRDNMLASHVRSFGIAYGPGPYWTLNLR